MIDILSSKTLLRIKCLSFEHYFCKLILDHAEGYLTGMGSNDMLLLLLLFRLRLLLLLSLVLLLFASLMQEEHMFARRLLP